MMTTEMFTKVVNVMTPGAEVGMLVHGQISHYNKYAFIYINIQHIDCYFIIAL